MFPERFWYVAIEPPVGAAILLALSILALRTNRGLLGLFGPKGPVG